MTDNHNSRQNSNKLIRMIIVDDEPIICEGLKMTIDWEQLGVEVAGVAYDGKQALEIVESEPIDIVLSDIRMDGMDGLELAEQLRNLYPSISIVIISGYDDFDYARRAMRLGVIDYLLKPVNIDELKTIVSKVITRIHESAYTISPEEAELWLINAIYNKSDYAEIDILRRDKYVQGSFFMITSQLMDFKRHYGEFSVEAIKRLQDEWMILLQSELHTLGLSTIFAYSNPNLLYTFINDEHNVLDDKKLEQLLQRVAAGWNHEGGMYFAVSTAYTELEKTAEMCEQVRRMLAYHVLLSEGEIVLNEQKCKELETSRRSSSNYSPPVDWVSRLSGLLYRQEWTEVKQMVESLFAQMRQQQLLLPELIGVYEEQMALLRQRLRNNVVDLEQSNERQHNVDLHQYNAYDALEQLLLDELHSVLELISSHSVNKAYWIVEKAMKYVIEHFSEDVKASEVAEWLNITPNHFSYIFKQNTGKNFKEYMNDVRISEAQRLLELTNDKVFEIADQVGYKEYKYFVTVFKSVTGMTPNEYRAIKASV